MLIGLERKTFFSDQQVQVGTYLDARSLGRDVSYLQKPLCREDFGIYSYLDSAGEANVAKICSLSRNRALNTLRTEARELEYLNSKLREGKGKRRVRPVRLDGYEEDKETDMAVLRMEFLPEGRKDFAVDDYLEVMEYFQSQDLNCPTHQRLLKKAPDNYLKEAARNCRFLKLAGSVKGLSSTEIELILATYQGKIPSLSSFGLVLTHGDLGRKHLCRKGNNIVIFDFGKVCVGSELEDPIHIAITTPNTASEIIAFLYEKFAQNKEKIENLPTALSLMALDRALEIYFYTTHHYQPAILGQMRKVKTRILLNRLAKTDSVYEVAKILNSFAKVYS